MMKIALLLTLLSTLPANASDLLLDSLAAEKARIADQYKTAIKACAGKAVTEAANCKSAADHTRQAALKAASNERDIGLKCRSTCGLLTEMRQEPREGSG